MIPNFRPKTQPNPVKLDAQESVFFTRELEYVKARTYDMKHRNLKAFELFPVSFEAPSGSTQITFRKYTDIGFAKIVQDYAKDFPRVDIYGEEETIKVRALGASYGYSIPEIRRSMIAGKQLDVRRASAARKAIDTLMNKLAFEGDSDFNIQGFINYPGITEYTVPNDGTGTSKLWTTKSADLIVRDLAGLVNAVVSTTNEVELPNTLILPVARYLLIANTRMGDGSDKSILRFFLDNNPHIDQIVAVPELAGAGVGATNRMMAYVRDEEHVTLEIPQAFEQLPEEQKGMEFSVACHAETAGVVVYYPMSVAYGDGI